QGGAAVGLIRARKGLSAEQINAAGDVIAEQRGIDEGEVTALAVLAVADGRLHRIAGAVEIAFANLDLGHPAVGGRIAAGNEELASRLVDRLHIKDDAIRR